MGFGGLMDLNKNGMKECPKCKSIAVGTELRCQGSYIATKCYSCGHEGPTSMSRDAAKKMWNESAKKKE